MPRGAAARAGKRARAPSSTCAATRLRPEGWTSADAAGLPIFPLLVRYPEVQAGQIDHALRVTVEQTQRGYIHPATHFASDSSDPSLPPMGLRLRLKASFSLAGYHGEALVVLRALKRYGLIVADNGSSWYITGAPDPRWNDEDLNQLKTRARVGLPGGARPGRSCIAAERDGQASSGPPVIRTAAAARPGLPRLGAGCAGGGGGGRGWRPPGRGCATGAGAGACGCAAASVGCCGFSAACVSPVTDSLNSRIPVPSERPISGSRLAPNTSSRITTRKAMWIGLSSPICCP